ncbi:MAG: PD-(D/E)XK nuclease family protein, partial [Planctomycetes bacterium]|nr:PD-(D/E)XK nuclease family protein [Planctomycetota bacterium]
MRGAALQNPANDASRGAVLKREVMFLWTLPAGELAAPADAAGGGFDESAKGDSEDAGDRAVVRGTIDALLLQDDALHVIDYKTDQAEMIESRLPVYIRQVRCYARAAAAILKRPVTGGTLVFLTARRLETVEVGPVEGCG